MIIEIILAYFVVMVWLGFWLKNMQDPEVKGFKKLWVFIATPAMIGWLMYDSFGKIVGDKYGHG